jgi:hypothetical protein
VDTLVLLQGEAAVVLVDGDVGGSGVHGSSTVDPACGIRVAPSVGRWMDGSVALG